MRLIAIWPALFWRGPKPDENVQMWARLVDEVCSVIERINWSTGSRLTSSLFIPSSHIQNKPHFAPIRGLKVIEPGEASEKQAILRRNWAAHPLLQEEVLGCRQGLVFSELSSTNPSASCFSSLASGRVCSSIASALGCVMHSYTERCESS